MGPQNCFTRAFRADFNDVSRFYSAINVHGLHSLVCGWLFGRGRPCCHSSCCRRLLGDGHTQSAATAALVLKLFDCCHTCSNVTPDGYFLGEHQPCVSMPAANSSCHVCYIACALADLYLICVTAQYMLGARAAPDVPGAVAL